MPAQVSPESKTAEFSFPDLALQQEQAVEVLFSVNGQDFPSPPAPISVDVDSESKTQRIFVRFQPAIDASPTV